MSGAALIRGVLLALVLLLTCSAPATAAEEADASVAHVEPTDDGVQILVSVPPGTEVDLDEVTATIDGEDAPAEAALADLDDRGQAHGGPGDRRQQVDERRAVRGGQDGRPDLPRHRPRRRLRGHRDLRERRHRRRRTHPGPRRGPGGDRGPRAHAARPTSTTGCWPRSTWRAPRVSVRCWSCPTAPTPATPRWTTSRRRYRRRGPARRGRAGADRCRQGRAGGARRRRRGPGDRRRSRRPARGLHRGGRRAGPAGAGHRGAARVGDERRGLGLGVAADRRHDPGGRRVRRRSRRRRRRPRRPPAPPPPPRSRD